MQEISASWFPACFPQSLSVSRLLILGLSMNFILHPWHLLLLTLSALINHERDKAIEYLLAENQVLREKLGKGRILLNDEQRKKLARRVKKLSLTSKTHRTMRINWFLRRIRLCYRQIYSLAKSHKTPVNIGQKLPAIKITPSLMALVPCVFRVGRWQDAPTRFVLPQAPMIRWCSSFERGCSRQCKKSSATRLL